MAQRHRGLLKSTQVICSHRPATRSGEPELRSALALAPGAPCWRDGNHRTMEYGRRRPCHRAALPRPWQCQPRWHQAKQAPDCPEPAPQHTIDEKERSGGGGGGQDCQQGGQRTRSWGAWPSTSLHACPVPKQRERGTGTDMHQTPSNKGFVLVRRKEAAGSPPRLQTRTGILLVTDSGYFVGKTCPLGAHDDAVPQRPAGHLP